MSVRKSKANPENWGISRIEVDKSDSFFDVHYRNGQKQTIFMANKNCADGNVWLADFVGKLFEQFGIEEWRIAATPKNGGKFIIRN